jgi:hypothetical protein
MSIDEERDLRLRLDGALEEITPSRAPVAATLRRGRTIRTRRRIGVAAGLAAVIGIALAAPGLVHQFIRQAPVQPVEHNWVLTVYPPGPHPPNGQIAWGTINGKRWQIGFSSPSSRDGQCMRINGQDAACNGGPTNPSQYPSDPVIPVGSAQEDGVNYMYAAVQPDVTRVVVALANGTELALHPARLYGQDWVAFPVPAGLAIDSATAYSTQSELGYAVPYGESFVTWLRPGERGLPRATYIVSSGHLQGPWSAIMHVGPWGFCMELAQAGSSGSLCYPGLSLAPTGNSYFGSAGTPPGSVIMVGKASPLVAYVVGTVSDGRTIRARAVDVGGPRFWAWTVPAGQRLRRVVFYSASGRQVAVQSGAAYNGAVD